MSNEYTPDRKDSVMGIKAKNRCIWYDGKDVYEVAFCNEFLKEHPMKFVDGKFYNTDGAVDYQTVKKMISDKLLAEQVQKDSARIKIVHFKQTNDMSRKPSARNERSEWRALGFGA